jgi:GAF domain-containing protein
MQIPSESTKPPIPPDEKERLQDLYALGLLDTPREERFDHYVLLAKRMFRVPIALISLIDVNRLWFKSCQGLSLSESPRDTSFCAYTILTDQTLIIPNTLEDPRFANNPAVTGVPFIRFYMGCPLHGPRKHRVGTLCLMDFVPRKVSSDESSALQNLAYDVEREVNTTLERYQTR